MKSTGRSDPLQRSAAFWGEESDMEESEMSVPMGTLKSDDLKDDFDFYDWSMQETTFPFAVLFF